MIKTKKILFVLILLVPSLACWSQSKVDSILSKNADNLNKTDLDVLIKSGYISNTSAPVIGTFMVSLTQNNKINNWTIRQLLDSVKAGMKKMDDATAIKYNYGKDSVFIREPNGNKMFMGMGELSFEKLVAKASLNLPSNYNGDYNLKINSAGSIEKLSLLVAESEYPWITGNVLLTKRDNGELKELRIGDILEIAKRIATAKEFAPFMKQ